MNQQSSQHAQSQAEFSALAAFVAIVAGSHLGMIWLADQYLYVSRATDFLVSPEQIAGIVALLALLIAFFNRPSLLSMRAMPFVFLILFCVLAFLSELSHPQMRPSNLTLYVGMMTAALTGSAVGQISVRRNSPLPAAGILLVVYGIWYACLFGFYYRGDLGFFSGLEGSFTIQRLSFVRGFSATEIPIWIGFHVPVLLFFALSVHNIITKIYLAAILMFGLIITAATASIGAFAGVACIAFIFLSRRSFNAWRIGFAILVLVLIAVGIDIYTGGELILSGQSKLTRFDAGEGARTLVYRDLIAIISETPMGIGKGRYVEMNRNSFDGTGLYPHHNILGILAELGWLLGVIYLVLIAYTFLAGMKVLSLLRELPYDTRHLRGLALAAIAIFAYQQIRGLLHDTWPQKELYLWFGLLCGMQIKLAALKAENVLRQRYSQRGWSPGPLVAEQYNRYAEPRS